MSSPSPTPLGSKYSQRVLQVIPPDIRSCPSLLAKQVIIQSYSPKVQVVSCESADNVAVNYGCSNCLELLGSFERTIGDLDMGAPAIHGSPSRIAVHFVRPQYEILSTQRTGKASTFRDLYGQESFDKAIDGRVSTVCDEISATDLFKSEISVHKSDTPKQTKDQVMNDEYTIDKCQDSIYLSFLSNALGTSTIVPFEFFNHCVMSMLVITTDMNSRQIQTLYQDFMTNSRKVPETWIDTSELSPVIFLALVDTDKPETLQRGLLIQDFCRQSLNSNVILVPVSFSNGSEAAKVVLSPTFMTSVDEPGTSSTFEVPRDFYSSVGTALEKFVYETVIPYMQKQASSWYDAYVAPRKSITGRLFKASRLWGGSSSKHSFFSFGAKEEQDEDVGKDLVYDPMTGCYPAKAPAVYIRRLGDWYFMLRDYKKAYMVYDMLKKEFLECRAYTYLSSLQEFMILSLMLGSSSKINPLEHYNRSSRANGITSKIISDVIAPMFDSSFYSYLSRCNSKTYTLRLALVVAEMYLVLGQSASYCRDPQFSKYILPPESYFIESQHLFKRIVDSKLVNGTCCGILMQRLAYIYFSYNKPPVEVLSSPPEASYYGENNPGKLLLPKMANFGLERTRQSILWELLAAKAFINTGSTVQGELMLWNIDQELRQVPVNKSFADDISQMKELVWPYRTQGLFNELVMEVKK